MPCDGVRVFVHLGQKGKQARLQCLAFSAAELRTTLLASVLFVSATVSLELSYRHVKAGLLADARYRLKKDIFAGIRWTAGR